MPSGMSSRFTHLDVLKGIGRNLLARFLDSFAADLAAKHISLPDAPFGIHFDPESSPYQIAVHVWLAVPELLVLTQTYTLEPLRTDGPDALDTAGVPAIKKITLRELGVASNNAFNEITIHKAE